MSKMIINMLSLVATKLYKVLNSKVSLKLIKYVLIYIYSLYTILLVWLAPKDPSPISWKVVLEEFLLTWPNFA
jgi:hypothetical protein